MLDLIASLLSGPERSDRVSGRRAAFTFSIPLMMLAALSLCAAVAGALETLRTGWQPAAMSAAFAACATLVCAVLGVAAACRGVALAWLLPLWAGAGVGAAGWVLLPLPHAPATIVSSLAVLALPIMVIGLAANWRRLPPGVYEAAAASGASPALAFRHVVMALAMTGLLRVSLMVLVVAAGWAMSMG